MALFPDKIDFEKIAKPVTKHPWQNRIKDEYSNQIKHAHNSIHNPVIPKPKEKEKLNLSETLSHIKFTVIGNRVSKEFIYCTDYVKGLSKYKSKYFDAPVIRGVSTVDWPEEWNKLKLQYGIEAFYLQHQVAILLNDEFLGGPKELEDIVSKYYKYRIAPDYPKESVGNFVRFVKGSGRPCAYLHISIDSKHIGTLIFMLYVDIVPKTVDNFLRLCQDKRGGYSGTPIHRIVKDSWVQGGGFNLKNNSDLACENFIVPHDRRGVLCMANADRDVDCSTQFFVLLQPQPWMADKYVAFGQLIEGASVLNNIEEVPTWYESPTQEIIIHNSGILNLECQDVVVNPSAREYIENHIENLTEIGNIFIEYLMNKVYLEIEFRMLQAIVAGEGEDAEKPVSKISPPVVDVKIHPEEQQKVPAVGDENNDFDVENYEEYEEFSVETTIPPASTPPPPPEVKYYLPLTDVLYPSEKDSTYDLKKFLQGHYCHEKDIEPDKRERFNLPKYKIRYNTSIVPKPEVVELDSSEEEEIKNYIRDNVDKVCFAGDGLIEMAMKLPGYIEWKSRQENFSSYCRRRSTDKSAKKAKKELSAKAVESDEGWIFKPGDFMVSGTHLIHPITANKPEHESAFAQLFEEVGISLKDISAPTLKNYRTLTEIQERYNVLRTSPATNQQLKAVDSKEKFSAHFSNVEALSLVYGKRLGRRISTDYATAVDQLSKQQKVSIRSMEYAKTRPSMSVAAYKERNRQLALAQKLDKPVGAPVSQTKKKTEAECFKHGITEIYRKV